MAYKSEEVQGGGRNVQIGEGGGGGKKMLSALRHGFSNDMALIKYKI